MSSQEIRNPICIEYWSDYVCPFCYIGIRHLKAAIAELGLEDRVQLKMRSFELDRYAPGQAAFNAVEHFALKYGIVQEKAVEMVEQISEKGKQAGIKQMDYGGTKTTNTSEAHQLTKYAETKGVDLQESLYETFFCKHFNIGERTVLKEISALNGLDPEEVDRVLETRAYLKDVRNDEKEASLRGIHMVPHFCFPGKQELSGSGSIEEFKSILLRCVNR